MAPGRRERLGPSGQALSEALLWAEDLARRPGWALAANKRMVKETRPLGLREALHPSSAFDLEPER